MSEYKEIPKGWIKTALGDMFLIERGGSPRPIEDFITEDENGINWIKIGDTKGITKYIYNTKEKIKPEGLHKSRMVYVDDLILSNSMSFGHPYIMKIEGCIHDGWLVIRTPKELINTNYLYHILNSSLVYQQFSNLAKGSTVKNLNIEAVEQVTISLPPLPEQHRIVVQIEELFSSLDKGIESLKKAQEQLKIYRQAVLKWAFEGKLTSNLLNCDSPDKYDVENKSQKNHDNQINHKNQSSGDLPEGWESVKFINFCKLQRGYDLPLRNLQDGIFPVVTSSGISGYHNEYKSLGPCLITGRSGGVGNIHFVDVAKYWPHNTVLYVKDFCGNIPKYMYYYFLQFNFKGFSASTTIPTLDRKQLYNEIVNVPPFEEQQSIVSEIEKRLSVCDKIEESISTSLLQAEALRQSILKKAFEGKLVPQDPNDEPARALLARIKAEKEKNSPAKKTRKKK